MFRLNPNQYVEEFLNIGFELVHTAETKPILTTNQTVEEIEYDHPITITSMTQILKSEHYRPVITYISKISLFFELVCDTYYL